MTNAIVTRTLIPKLTRYHREADSKMIYHLPNLEEYSKVIIRISEKVVLVIRLGCLEYISEYIIRWLSFYSKNSLRYCDVKKLFNELGKDLCRAWPALHAFNCSDYTAAFSTKGKTFPLKTLEKNETIQGVFGVMRFSDVYEKRKN